MTPRFALCLLAAVLSLPGACRAEATESGRPNILFLFNDDQRADTIAALGNPHIRTPNLDRLCHSGIMFSRAYMQGGFHGATCMPSRAMLLSGRSLFRMEESLKTSTTWPANFGKAGYTTFATGKWHNSGEGLINSFQEARSIFADGMANPLKAPLCDVRNGKLTPPKTSAKHACAVFADEAISFLNRPHDKPFFCYVAFDGPHDPHIVPKDFPVHYDPAQIPLPANFLPNHPFDNGEMSIRDEMLLPHPRPPEQVRKMLADYYRYISYLDMLVGNILDALEKSPHAKNTIIVFSSDSGVARGSHGLIGKQNLYEHSVRVPLIIAGPGIPKGKQTEAMCYLYDVLPTLGAMCGVPEPSTGEGRDFSGVLRDPATSGRPELIFAYRDIQRAVATKDWKLIRYPKVNQTQLFDLRNDPNETRNLAADPAQADRLKALSALLHAKLAEAGDAPCQDSPSKR